MLNLKSLPKEDIREMSFIEMAFELLAEEKQPISFQDLMKTISKLTGWKGEKLKSQLVQFYTDLNFDGRFLTLGENRWGLRAWYPVEQIEEETVPTVKVRKKKSKKAAVLDDDIIEEEDLDFEDLDDLEEDLVDDDEDDDDDTDVVDVVDVVDDDLEIDEEDEDDKDEEEEDNL
jgi:DNA-directed RNA polymerase subunit delta